MLFTRCPECRTTFRITLAALHKAGGQVRCGRCACVFDAYTELRRSKRSGADTGTYTVPTRPQTTSGEDAASVADDRGDIPAETADEAALATPREAPPGQGVSVEPAAHSEQPEQAEQADQADQADQTDQGHHAEQRDAEPPEQSDAPPEPTTLQNVLDPNDPETFGDTTLALVIAELEASAEQETPEAQARSDAANTNADTAAAAAPPAGSATRQARAGDTAAADIVGAPAASTAHAADDVPVAAPIPTMPSDEQHADTILSSDVDPAPVPQAFASPADGRSPTRTRLWSLATGLAALVLGAQITHHFRGELATTPTLGPWVQQLYARLGVELVPDWDLAQYEIFDTTAVAEPNANGQGNLSITAQLRNAGPRAQPFPYVRVDLKDRWETTLSSHVFGPVDYLTGIVRTDRPMQARATVRATFDVTDPGVDAYGFELSACIHADSERLRCQGDAERDVFH